MPDTTLPIAQARLAAFFIENVIYGLYIATCGYTLNALFSTGARWRRFNELNYSMIAVALVMFLNSTIALGVGFYVIWRGFIIPPEAGGGTQTFGNISNWSIVIKSVVLLLQTTVGDAMLIYRCWVVYNHSLLAVGFSIVMWCGGTVCSVFLVFYEATFRTQTLVSNDKLHPFGVAFWAITVVLNVITTALLVWPIWKVTQQNERFGYRSTTSDPPTRLKNVMQIIIESGLLYTTMAFMTFVTYTSGSNSLYIVSSAEVGIAGIAFNLIIIRTAKSTRNKEISTTGATAGTTLPLHIMGPPARDTTLVSDNKNQGLHVLVSRDITQGSSMDRYK
ncbi:hypothetical protein BDQ12DRAFT_734622 [Crucibulum laeve]|uniref:G-protein coupled receptors family 1 profile domain-containing protein n=1 Tax=Crucibulum laeve TaxID=68775 RepID=A0A5C3M3V8_9AGAR|nr:hypothetical protein BDQ12DRAFT_734622 [Crucibulum laeve]